jgi:hypothetical protein
MSGPHKVALLLTIIGAGVGIASSARAQYTLTDLTPTGPLAGAFGVSGGTQVGVAFGEAALWSGTAASFVNLDPSGYTGGRAEGVSGAYQVGQVGNGTNGFAALWNGTAASFVNLDPSGGTLNSVAFGVSGGTQVGEWLNASESNFYAAVWNGTAASFVDLDPSGGTSNVNSAAYGASGATQVGLVGSSAALWHGTASSLADLNPAGYNSSVAYAASGNFQAGDAVIGSYTHAALWNGTASSFVDLNPAGYLESEILGIAGGQEAGFVTVGVNSPRLPAVWYGAASNVTLLPLGSFGSAFATGIDANGDVVGEGFLNGGFHALLWTPSGTPEPFTATIAISGLGLAIRNRAKAKTTTPN